MLTSAQPGSSQLAKACAFNLSRVDKNKKYPDAFLITSQTSSHFLALTLLLNMQFLAFLLFHIIM